MSFLENIGDQLAGYNEANKFIAPIKALVDNAGDLLGASGYTKANKTFKAVFDTNMTRDEYNQVKLNSSVKGLTSADVDDIREEDFEGHSQRARNIFSTLVGAKVSVSEQRKAELHAGVIRNTNNQNFTYW